MTALDEYRGYRPTSLGKGAVSVEAEVAEPGVGGGGGGGGLKPLDQATFRSGG